MYRQISRLEKKINPKDIQLGAAPELDNKEYTGVLSLFFTDKAYGFITEDGSKNNIFVHSNKMVGNIKEKDKVRYEKEKTPKGYAAINVQKIN